MKKKSKRGGLVREGRGTLRGIRGVPRRRRGGRVAEHPCVLEARLFGVSKMKTLRTVRGHLGLLWQVVRGRID